MLKHRIITCLDVKHGRVVLGRTDLLPSNDQLISCFINLNLLGKALYDNDIKLEDLITEI